MFASWMSSASGCGSYSLTPFLLQATGLKEGDQVSMSDKTLVEKTMPLIVILVPTNMLCIIYSNTLLEVIKFPGKVITDWFEANRWQ